MNQTPVLFKAKKFKKAEAALAYIKEIYTANTDFLRKHFQVFFESPGAQKEHISAHYPYVRLKINDSCRSDTRFAYGFVSKPGVYEATLTRPDVFAEYYLEQMQMLLATHNDEIEIGVSELKIPIHFALGENFHVEKNLTREHLQILPLIFDVPDLSLMDDSIANGTHTLKEGEPSPLSLFSAPRVDLSLMRLRHYTGTDPVHFQKYVILTNYQFYTEEFLRIAHEMMKHELPLKLAPEYEALVEPGNRVSYNRNIQNLPADLAGEALRRSPQMPAYHLKRTDGEGITMINIGVGPSNAKTITDHLAVLRPHAWLMLGHCAGLRTSQNIGDYVLAHAYLREDNVLFGDLHPSIPIPALSEIQIALEQAMTQVTGLSGYELKKIMRTGTVVTVDDRNWELRSAHQNVKLSQSRAVALDMESGTVAANGFRFRVPYGALLCVSDKPLHGQLKLPGMAESFYRDRVNQHFQIGLKTMSLLRELGAEKLHSRKLRSFHEVAFR